MSEERLTAPIPNSGYLLKHRGCARFGAPLAVAGDRKTVCLIADLLDEKQCQRVRRQYSGGLLPGQEKPLLAGFAPLSLGHAHQTNILNPQLVQDRLGDTQLPFPAVYEQQIRKAPRPVTLLVPQPPVTACQRLGHGSVVVARLDAVNIETAIIGFQWALWREDHAGSDGCLALGVADVETLNALRYGLKAERLLQCLEAIAQAGAIVQLSSQGFAHIEFSKFYPATSQAAWLAGDAYRMLGLLGKNRLEPILLEHRVVKVNLRRDKLTQIILAEKGQKDFSHI